MPTVCTVYTHLQYRQVSTSAANAGPLALVLQKDSAVGMALINLLFACMDVMLGSTAEEEEEEEEGKECGCMYALMSG